MGRSLLILFYVGFIHTAFAQSRVDFTVGNNNSSAFHGSVEKAQEWREKGMLIQMNINSIFGHYGPGVKKQAEKLIDSGQIDLIATDCHRIDHLNLLEQNLSNKYLRKVLELPLHNINL